MGFWPFGRDGDTVELISRVITAATQNGFRVRGKLTIHFSDPQAQVEADRAADRCSALAMALLREAPDHGRVIGAEAVLSTELSSRYPSDVARARQVELAALHVVGDPALSDELRRASSVSPSALAMSGRLASSGLPSASFAGGLAPGSRPPPSSSNPPAAAGTTLPAGAGAAMPGMAAPRRRVSSQIRSIRSLLLPPGTAPAGMGAFVSPVVRDSAARLLIGYLRAHDLVVRGAEIDQASADVLASLVPVSNALPGGYEASRASEINRWQGVLGAGIMYALQHEVRAASVYLVKAALERIDVMPALTDAVVEATASSAFPEEAGILAEFVRFMSVPPDELAFVIAESLSRIAGGEDQPEEIASALAPLVAMVREELDVAAMIIKSSSGG